MLVDPTLCAVLTTFNRPEVTRAALEGLRRATELASVLARVVVVDASTSDATFREIMQVYPDAEVLRVPSTTFWAEGMRLGVEQALRSDSGDYILWLNDDVLLDGSAIQVLLSTMLSHPDAIIGGAVTDQAGRATYGGYLRGKATRRLNFQPVPVSPSASRVDLFNGNILLFTRHAAEKFPINPRFSHGMADFDTTLRAGRAGVPLIQAPGSLGFCDNNPIEGSWRDTSLSTADRWRVLMGPKGLPPREWIPFALRWGGLLGPAYALKPYATLLMSGAPGGRRDVADPSSIKQVQVGPVQFNALSPEEVVTKIAEQSLSRGSLSCHLVNSYNVHLADTDSSYLALLGEGDLVLCDGKWVSLFSSWSSGKRLLQVRGPSLMKRVLDEGRAHGLRHFFLGSTDDVLERLERNTVSAWPGSQIAGTFSPPFRSLGDDDFRQFADLIARSHANVVWVGMGTPLQDWVVARLARHVDMPVIAVGAAFDFLSGNKREAPGWLRVLGLEWFFRLVSEPRRLWRRYLLGNMGFVRAVVRQKVQGI